MIMKNETIVQSEQFSSFTTESCDPSTFIGSGARPKSPYQSPMAEKSKASHQRPSAGALTSTSGNGPQKKPSCVLCKKHAFTDQCPAFPTLEKRRQKFTELCLCFNCMRHSHTAQNVEVNMSVITVAQLRRYKGGQSDKPYKIFLSVSQSVSSHMIHEMLL